MHVNTTAIHGVNKMNKMNKALMSDMLSRHQNWFIQKDLCLVHSKFPTAIEASIAVCYSRAAFINISALKCGV